MDLVRSPKASLCPIQGGVTTSSTTVHTQMTSGPFHALTGLWARLSVPDFQLLENKNPSQGMVYCRHLGKA